MSASHLDDAIAPDERARRILDGAWTRGEIKRHGELLDRPDQQPLRDALITLARQRGVRLPDDAVKWPGKRLVRAALDREARSRQVGNPIRHDEAFVCAHCGRQVPPHGRTARDHCPTCLRSLHVDVVPGDRAAECAGLLDPIGLELRSGEPVLRYRCRKCGMTRNNRALTDGAVPDDPNALVRMSRGEAP